MGKCVLLFFIIFFAVTPSAFAEGIIGRDQIISVNTVSFLQLPDNPEYAQVFDYFVTIELFAGIIGCFIQMVLRVFRS